MKPNSVPETGKASTANWRPPLELSTSGDMLITGEAKVLERCAEHFESVYNYPLSSSREAIACLPHAAVSKMEEPSTGDKVAVAIGQMSHGEAPGSNVIPAEIHSAGSPHSTASGTRTNSPEIWVTSIIHLYKRKGQPPGPFQPQRHFFSFHCG